MSLQRNALSLSDSELQTLTDAIGIDVGTEVAMILVDAYEDAGFDTSKLSVYDMLLGLCFDGEETGKEAYQLIVKVLSKEVIRKIKEKDA